MQEKINAKQNEINMRFTDWQKAAKFPKAKYFIGFHNYARLALLQKSPVEMKITADDFKEIVDSLDKSFNVWYIAPLLDAMSRTSPDKYGITDLEAYTTLIKNIEGMIEALKTIIKPKMEELQKELNEYAKELRETTEEVDMTQEYLKEVDSEEPTTELPALTEADA